MIVARFLQFKKQFGNEVFSRLNEFFDAEKKIFYNEKIPYWTGQGYTNEEAVIKAMSNPLLEVDYQGGSGALIHITGGDDLRLDEVNLVGEYVSKQLDPEAQVIWGARVLPEYAGKIHVITIITGVKSPYILGPVQKENLGTEKNVVHELGIPMAL
jgi:cell division GTPase FtsZ